MQIIEVFVNYRLHLLSCSILIVIAMLYYIHGRTKSDKNPAIWNDGYYLFWYMLLALHFAAFKYLFNSPQIRLLFWILSLMTSGVAIYLFIKLTVLINQVSRNEIEKKQKKNS